MGALVRSELGKVGWSWKKIRKKKGGGRLKFERFWFLESEGNKLAQSAFSLQGVQIARIAYLVPSVLSHQSRTSASGSKTVPRTSASTAASNPCSPWPPRHSPMQHSHPVYCHRNKKTQQKARYRHVGAFYMQSLLCGGQQGEGITRLHSLINPCPGHCSANCVAPS